MSLIRSFTEGFLLTILYTILLIALLFLPILGSFILFLLPLPFIIYVTRHSFKKGLVLLTVALIITYLIGSVALFPITFMFGTTGIIMGYVYSLREKSAFSVLISGSLSFLANFVILFIISNVFFKINFIEVTKRTMYQSMENAEKMITAMGQPADQFKIMYELIEFISYIVPSVMVVTSITLAFVTQFICNFFLKKIRYDVTPFPPLRKWEFPRSLLWYYFIITILYMLGFDEGTNIYSMVINFLIVLELIMAIQGFSFIFLYFYTKRKSLIIPIVILFVSLLLPFLLYLIRILGIIDLGFNLRRRINNPQ